MNTYIILHKDNVFLVKNQLMNQKRLQS